MNRILQTSILLLLVMNFSIKAQSFYITGSTSDQTTNPLPGLLLSGGAGDHDNSMKWFLQRANGGDIVVLRSSGSDGYNNYLYSQLGETVNSVTSIVISSVAAANTDTVYNTIRRAEALFIAGGNQWDYMRYFKNSKVQEAFEYLIDEKGVTIGGTSAGMAVLGQIAFTAQNSTVYSSEALSDPYHFRVKLDTSFVNHPFLQQTVTDTHYNRPDNPSNPTRKGRHITFMARMIQDWDMHAKGIAANEYTAIAVDDNGIARVFGNPSYDDFAYFLQKYGGTPEICQASTPLTWNRNQQAVMVYKVKGTQTGENTFNISNWQDGQGGTWETWYVEAGVLFENPSSGPLNIDGYQVSGNTMINSVIYQRNGQIKISADFQALNTSIRLVSLDGKLITEMLILPHDVHQDHYLSCGQLSPGIFLLQILNGCKSETRKLFIQ
jgi:cyanophycinase-like exopeptidase